MPEQLSLHYDADFARAEAWDDFLECVRTIVQRVGLKQAAYDLDVQPSVLSHALAERDRHYLRLEWLHWFVVHDTDGTLVQHIAGWRGLEVKPRLAITPEEWRSRIEGALASMPELADLIRKKAGV